MMPTRRFQGGRVSVPRRAVVFLPNGVTLFNLFCGIYAIVLATRQDFATATLFVVIGGIADTLDGRIARATRTGSRFGEELDSLVDAISFGLAPAMIMYFAVLNQGNWEWLLVFIFTACAVMRLARFNVEQAGRKKTHFHGLPSPAAGITLASYYWFSQTPLYNQTIILFTDSKTLADLPWHKMLTVLMGVLAGLMLSDVPYAAVPTVGFKSMRQAIGSLIVFGSIAGLIFLPKQFIFPALFIYVAFGLVKSVVLGFLGRSRSPQDIFWEEEPADDEGEPGDGAPPLPHDAAASRHPGTRGAEVLATGRDFERQRSDDVGQSKRRRRRRNRPGGSGGTGGTSSGTPGGGAAPGSGGSTRPTGVSGTNAPPTQPPEKPGV